MKSWTGLRQFLVFTAVGFGPVLVMGGVLLAGVLLNLAITPLEATPAALADILVFASYAVAILVVLIGLPALTFVIFKKTDGWLVGGVALYGAWLLFTIVIAYLLSGAMAGVSMAVVDGAADTDVVRGATLQQAMSLVLVCQVAIVPWVIGASWILRRYSLASPKLSSQHL